MAEQYLFLPSAQKCCVHFGLQTAGEVGSVVDTVGSVVDTVVDTVGTVVDTVGSASVQQTGSDNYIHDVQDRPHGMQASYLHVQSVYIPSLRVKTVAKNDPDSYPSPSLQTPGVCLYSPYGVSHGTSTIQRVLLPHLPSCPHAPPQISPGPFAQSGQQPHGPRVVPK